MNGNDLRTIEQRMIRDDAGFMIGLLLATQQLPSGSDVPYLFSCIDFHSLIMYETYNYYRGHDPAFATRLKHSYEDDIKQSRQRVKLYNDKKLGIEGIGESLFDIISSAHQKELSKTHRIKLPRWMWKDVGLYFVEGRSEAIGSTHLGSFNTGIDVSRMFDSATAKGFGEELGRFFVEVAGKNIVQLTLPQLNIVAKDIHSEELYTERNYGSSSKIINAGLSIIDMNLNFIALCLPPSMRHTTLFKWKFLMIYHIISSLRMLHDSPHAEGMDARVLRNIERVLDTDLAHLLAGESASILRNTLTHYGVDTRIDVGMLNTRQKLLYGLVEASLPGLTYADLAKKLDVFIQDEALNMFRAW